ncbi:MAG: DinB family protein [Intrasporangiaceae bacterium]|nr:DinB family protein [Intrasporangiaceae bacterium]
MSELVTALGEQLEWHWKYHARPRLEGLTDEEYRWGPAPGAWTVRPQDDAAPESVNYRAGAGDWLIDWAMPEPTPAPLTSIAWRMAHIVVGVFGARTHSHFGGPESEYATWDYAGTAAEGLAQLDDAYRRWTEGVRGLTDETLWRPVGPAEGPWQDEPMITLVLHINREAIHHLAEIALLRDLWAHRSVS